MDAEWLIPLGVATGMLIGSDQHTMTSAIQISPDGQKKANTISTGGVAALGALPAGAYLWSLFNHAPQARETGLLAGEALAKHFPPRADDVNELPDEISKSPG